MTITEVGVAIDVQERLEQAGHQVTWQSGLSADACDRPALDVVIVSGGDGLALVIDAWRALPTSPAVVVFGTSQDADVATAKKAVLVTSTAEGDGILAEIEKALSSRFGSELSINNARAALGLNLGLDEQASRVAIVGAGRNAPAAIVRQGLSGYPRHYAQADSEIVAALRAARALDVPEIELCGLCNGEITLRRVASASQLGEIEAGQRLWSLASVGAIKLSAEPSDDETQGRRRVVELRAHLRRRTGLTMTTAYDVLEVCRGVNVTDLEAAVRSLGFRYAPQVTSQLDLGDCEELSTPLWEKVLAARSALYYDVGQAQLNAFIDAQPGRFTNSWGRGDLDAVTAQASFARGFKALSSGEVFHALSAMAGAARSHPGHPVYESFLAWTRYRAEVARGGDRAAAAKKERHYAEMHIDGRRPFAQALVALGLLCVADGDAASARWHLSESLAIDPDLPAAKAVLKRLG